MTKHTPGPWRIHGRVIRVPGRGVIAEIPGPETVGVFDWLDNARLIAAAPDLLEAVKQMIGVYDDYGAGFYNQDEFVEGVDKARAAIAKAEGK